MLKVIDFGVRAQPIGFAAESLDAFDEHAAVPGTIEDADPTDTRNMPPEAPHVRLRTLLLSRRGDRDDLVLARIHGRRDAADAAALAGGIGAFEGQDQRVFLEFRVTQQLGQPPLPLGQLRLIGFLVELLRQIKRRQHVEAVDLGRHRRRHRVILVTRVGQAFLQRVEYRLAHGQRPVTVVGPFDDDPRRPRRIGHAQDMAGCLLQLVVGLQTRPAFLGHTPSRARIVLDGLETLLLRRFGKVKPELEHQRAFVDQHGLEAVDLVHALVEITLRQLTTDTLGDRIRVPGTGEDADPSLGWQRAPETPHVRALALLVGRRGKSQRREVTWVHPLVEYVDRLAFARAVDTTDQDDDRKLAVLAQIELGVEQRRTQLRLLVAEGFLVNGVAKFCRFEHDLALRKIAPETLHGR